MYVPIKPADWQTIEIESDRGVDQLEKFFSKIVFNELENTDPNYELVELKVRVNCCDFDNEEVSWVKFECDLYHASLFGTFFYILKNLLEVDDSRLIISWQAVYNKYIEEGAEHNV